MNQKFAIDGVEAQTPLRVAAPAMILAKAKPLFELEAAAAGGADMDAVHDMRVASRRLREVMRLLEPLYPGPQFAAWFKRVRRVTRALGPVRDSDVFIDDFSRLSSDLGEGGRRCVAFMVGYRMGQREGELATLNHELARLDLARSKRDLSRLVRSVEDGPDAARPLADFAHAAVAQRAAVVFGAQPAAMPEENMLEQHALRIDYKRLRYAVEAFAPCYGDDFDELHATLTAFQDTLGELHDVDIFLDMLRLPERVVAASRGGVSQSDVAEVIELLERRAHAHYLRFVALVEAHPAERLLPALLLPLVKAPEPIIAEAHVVEPVIEAPTKAVLVSPDDDGAVPGDETPIVGPVVVGAEPWARTDVADEPGTRGGLAQ
ncbi:MAG: CHAD domain-containing protein [Coriobacteriia bacterium]|nr:CHAD domain-containing protein [Coriobacteriia bacterium]